ncbi:MAG: hypothetical protein PHR35_14845 [Kiritimatiellae bacterium]|nr:hypothetical protein [Kiritimatiellia bacterium]
MIYGRNLIVMTALFTGAVSVHAGTFEISLPNDAVVRGTAPTGTTWVSDGSLEIALPISPDRELEIRGRSGKSAKGFEIAFQGAGKPAGIRLAAQDAGFKIEKKIGGEGADKPAVFTGPDACLSVQGNLRHFIRPNLRFYGSEEQETLMTGWDALPSAGQHTFTLLLRFGTPRVELWVDGRYAGEPADAATNVVLRLAEGAALESARWRKPDPRGFLCVDLGSYARPGVFSNAVASISTGRHEFDRVPMRVAAPAQNVDVGASRLLIDQGQMLEDPYYERSAFDGLRENLLFSVPRRQYAYAHLLCALEDDPVKSRKLNVRLTRYCRGGRGDAFADTLVEFPASGEALPQTIHQVGTLDLTNQGVKMPVPLYLVRVPLKIGAIQDLLADDTKGWWGNGNYFDLELTGEMENLDDQEWGLFPSNQGFASTRFKPGKQPNAVHVFGLTLEESPVTMLCRTRQAGNVFYASEEPGYEIHLCNNTAVPQRLDLRWAMTDFFGKEQKQNRKIALPAGATNKVIFVPLSVPDVGWYGIRFSLCDKDGREWVRHPNSFAVLPPDTRQAGYESPYGTWWFVGVHGQPREAEPVGPLFLRAGLRRLVMDWQIHSEATLAPYKCTLSNVRYLYRHYHVDFDQWFSLMTNTLEQTLVRFPHCNLALIFHEDFGPNEARGPEWFPFPPELTGGTPPRMNAAQEKIFQEHFWKKATGLTEYYRKNHPGIKLIFGNTGWSGHLIAEFLRRGYPRENIDYFGIEMNGQTCMPEKLFEGTMLGGSLLARETAGKFGYDDVPIAGCPEWSFRSSDRLGYTTHAEWLMRDCLSALVFGSPLITPFLICDQGNSYYHSAWGGGNSFMTRNPLLQPKPAYVAMATLTRVLDRATYKKAVPTGSTSLHIVEFDTSGGRVYALWTLRGEREVTLRFASKTKLTSIDIMGRERKLANAGRQLRLPVGTGVTYLKSESEIVEAIPGKPKFPEDPVPENAVVVAPMDAPAGWRMAEEKDARLERSEKYMPFQTLGRAELKRVDDPAKGACVELTLIPSNGLPDIVSEYVFLKLKEPVAIPGEPTALGVWVKGNSSWGRVMWEFEDAKGETWLSCGRDDWGCDILDWPGNISINFDGWNFLKLNLPVPIPAGREPATWLRPQWFNSDGDLRVDFPIKLTGLVVAMNAETPYLDRMVPVRDLSIRLKAVSAIFTCCRRPGRSASCTGNSFRWPRTCRNCRNPTRR